MLYYTLRPSVENISEFISTLEQYFNADRGSEWVVSAFEILSNIVEHNFYGKKIPSLSIPQLKRESKKHHKHKILIKLYTKTLVHHSCQPKKFAMRCCFTPILPPIIPSKFSIQNKIKLQAYKPYFLQNGRGMHIIYRFCTLRLVKITSKKYCIALQGH